jgi:DNA-binding CsgD family transcriptional regulator
MTQAPVASISRRPETNSDDAAHTQRIIGITQRRESPHFIICDSSMRVLFSSPGVDPELLGRETLKSLESRCRESRTSRTTAFHAYSDDTVLRIVPLGEQLFGCVAIFVDTFSRRGSIFEAAKTFGLTKRESEVLQLLIRGTTTTEIADALCVAEGTAGDHVKSVMRKTGTSKRLDLVSKVFKLEQDIAAEQLA